MSFSRCISTPIYVYTYYCSTSAPTLGEVSIELIPLQFPYFPHTMPQLQGVDGWYEINWCMSLTNNIGQIGKKKTKLVRVCFELSGTVHQYHKMNTGTIVLLAICSCTRQLGYLIPVSSLCGCKTHTGQVCMCSIDGGPGIVENP